MSLISRLLSRTPQRASALLLALSATLAHTAANAQVGMARTELAGLPVALVYPTAQPANHVVQGSFEIDVAVDAAPMPGQHSLVVMSHGTGGSALSDHALAATLARAGFVVAQPQHAGDSHADMSMAGPAAWDTRPREISTVIDGLAASTAWQPLLQWDKVGVHGMSAGGGTALVMAGARWRVLDLARHCAEHGDDDPGFCFTGLAAIRIPVAIVGARRDQNLLPAFHNQRVLKACGACIALDDLSGAGHFDLLAPWPADIAQRVGATQARGGYPEPGFDPALRQAAFDKIAEFFDQTWRH